MDVPLLITTSSRRALSTWRCVSGKAYRSLSRPSLARRPVLSRMATPPTSLCLARQVSASYDKSLPRTTSPAPTSAWAQTHSLGVATNAYGEANLHVMQERQLAAMQTTCPGRSHKCEPDWPRCHHIAINLRSATHKTQPRHSSTLYDARGPGLTLTLGKTSENSGRLKQAQTTREEGQASRKEQFNPATRWPPRQAISTRCRYTEMDNDVRRDVPAASHCNSFVFPLCPPLETIKGRGGQQSQGLDFHTIIHHHPGLGNELPLPTSL
jgi:hypothetical protein